MGGNTKVKVGPNYVTFYCPGCKELHALPKQNFNGDVASPSMLSHSSIMVTADHGKGHGYGGDFYKCHFYLRGGVLYYWTNYCTHQYSGQKVRMLSVDQWFTDVEPKVVGTWPYPELSKLA